MKTIIEKLKAFMPIIKVIFFTSIVVLIIVELMHLKQTISVKELGQVLQGISWLNIFLIFLVGTLAVFPTTGYDFIVNRILKTNHSKSYILQTSWCINTFNNLTGFGGIIDIGLRLAFYGKKGEEERELQEVTRFLPYLISGLSFISLVSLGLVSIFPVTRSVRFYDIILLASTLYFPLIYWFSGRKNNHYFGNMPAKIRLQLGLVSLFEWTCAALAFIIIGYLMGIDLPFYKTLPLFSIACAAGIVSLIPGGLGSFELVLFTGFAAEGLPKETVVAWLLLYRLAYYILPFFAGIYFFVRHLGHQINQRYQGAPRELLSSSLHSVMIHAVRWLGISLVFSTLFFEKISHLSWLDGFGPLQKQLIWQFPGLLIGVCFILLARAIANGVKRAYSLMFLGLAATLVYINTGSISWQWSLAIVLLGLGTVLIRTHLYKAQFIYSWEGRTKDIILISSMLFILFTLASLIFPYRAYEMNQHLGFSRYFLTWKHILLATSLVTLAYACLVRYLYGGKTLLGETFEHDRYQRLLSEYGGSADSGLAFIKNKRLFWYQEEGLDKAAFQFSTINNKAVVMGEPAGNPETFKNATRAFIEAADRLNYDLVFYSIGKDMTLFLHEYGFEFMKVGENALVDLDSFHLKGNKYKPFRNALNRVQKEGFTFEISPQPHSKVLLDELETISNKWLEKRQEKRFSLGFFDRDYFQEAPLALVKNKEQEIVAFANIMPNHQNGIVSIDLMRYDAKKIPNGVMDYLFLSLFIHFKEEGLAYFDLGMAPLWGVGQVKESFLHERLAYLLYNFGTHFYSFEGLHQYKKKFNPIWEERYVSVAKSSWLLYAILGIFLLDTKLFNKKRRSS
ncbi:bifunctional lysylphosphatidylglycerol flippase/synthetase MprF [Streptococcus ferus]|uniref:Phosphatidylglycerol lysyltransferase n=1 Tax=Streptococcus ferus TaxID=1345 RepID=A0A2X3VIP8_9STRE|nr:bifunctional lysylphosphatidylglycerol flippase/synthetase MprF [Streptococcus ferus]SQF41184.1 phosphatidylglycerol lysyltransferase [Streptococcus ferus]